MNRKTLQCLHGKLLNILKPFLEWASGKHMPYTHKTITGLDYYRIQAVLRPGDIFLTRVRGELTTLIIPGYFSHAAIYAPEGPGIVNEYVIEAEGPGVRKTDLVTFLMTKDVVRVERAYVPIEISAKSAEIATQQIGAPYDYAFEFHRTDQKAFYCSELVWWAYDKACDGQGVTCPFEPREQLGVDTVSPDDIAGSSHFYTIYDSRIKQPVIK